MSRAEVMQYSGLAMAAVGVYVYAPWLLIIVGVALVALAQVGGR